VDPRLDEPDESDKSDESRRSRRRFMVGAIKAGTVAGATVWAAPKFSSVALAQETAGSPAPTTTSTEPPEVEPEVEVEPELAQEPEADGEARVGGAQVGIGELPVTGSDISTLVIGGGAAVLTGEALLLMQRYFPEQRLALPAGATDAPAEGHPGVEPPVP